MRNLEDRTIQVHRVTSLLRINICLIGAEPDSSTNFRSMYSVDFRICSIFIFQCRYRNEMQIPCRSVVFNVYWCRIIHSPFSLILKLQFMARIIIHLPNALSSERLKDVILVISKVLISRRHEVICIIERQRPYRELERWVFLFVERPCQLSTIIPLMAVSTISAESLQEQMRVQCRHCSSAETQPVSIYEVMRDDCIHRSHIKLTTVSRLTCLHEILRKHLQYQLCPPEVFAFSQPIDEVIHIVLTPCQRQCSIFLPILLVSYSCAWLFLCRSLAL